MRPRLLALVVALWAAYPADGMAQGSVVNAAKSAAKAARSVPRSLPKAVPKRVPTLRPVRPGGPGSVAAGLSDEGALAASAIEGAPAPALESGASELASGAAAAEAPESGLRKAGKRVLDLGKETAEGELQDRIMDRITAGLEDEPEGQPKDQPKDQPKVQLSAAQVKMIKDVQRSQAVPPADDAWVYPLGIVVLVAGIWAWLRRA